ncbi:MAG: phospholipid-binding protein MlaC [Steroidobacteraceae bacterium]
MRSQLLKSMWVVVCLMLGGAFSNGWAADANRSPDKVVESVAGQVLADLDKNRETYRKDAAQLRQMIDKYLLANFDTEYAARLVLAKYWRTASELQRQQFIDAFYQSLLQNYGNSLLDFTADRLNILPYQGKAEDTTATVRSEIRRDNGSKVPVNYTLHKTKTGWKAYDITIEGISYVKSFRTDFGTEIEQKGLDAVIKRLQTQQATPISTNKSI